MLDVIKKQRDTNNLTLYCIVLLRVISVMNIFPHAIAISPEIRRPHSSKIRPNAPFSFLGFIFF